jgi:hypothetical protein
MAEIPEAPFYEVRRDIDDFRNTLTDIIKEQYAIAIEKNWDRGSIPVQEKIYNTFMERITPQRIYDYYEKFHKVLDDREKILKKNVTTTTKEIKSWERYNKEHQLEKYNEGLGEINFLKVVTRYTDTKTVREIITPVKEYLSEEEMDAKIEEYDKYIVAKKTYDAEILKIENDKLSQKEKTRQIKEKKKDEPKSYVPPFLDIDSDVNLKKIEILAAANLTVLYDKNAIKNISEEDLTIEKLTESKAIVYPEYSRLKRSHREAGKFVDSLIIIEGIPLRAQDDVPYDNMGKIIGVRNAEEMYKLLNRIIETSTTHPQIDNMNTKEQNDYNKSNKKPLKLRMDNYIYIQKGKSYITLDTENFKEVMQQVQDTANSVSTSKKWAKSKGKIYSLTDDEKEMLRQGPKIGHTIGTFKMETQIMTPEMLEMFFKGHIAPDGSYFNNRDLKRKAYLLNPEICPARMDMKKAKELKEEKRKSNQGNNPVEYKIREDSVESEPLPSVDRLAQLLEQLFLPAYQRSTKNTGSMILQSFTHQ